MSDSRKRFAHRVMEEEVTDHQRQVARRRELINKRIEEYHDYDDEDLAPKYQAEADYFLRRR